MSTLLDVGLFCVFWAKNGILSASCCIGGRYVILSSEYPMQHGKADFFTGIGTGGVAGMIALFVFCNTKVQYSPERLIFKYPLRKKQKLPWSQIQRIETVLERKQGRMTWKRLRFYSKEGTYKINMRCMTYGKDGFMTQLMAAVQKYKIPCVSARK